MAVERPAAGRLTAQAAVAASQPPKRRDWPWDGLNYRSSLTWQAPGCQHACLKASGRRCFESVSMSAGGPGPRIIGSSWTRNFHHFHQPPGVLGSTAKASLRALVYTSVLAGAAACCGDRADCWRAWHAPKHAVGSLTCLLAGASSALFITLALNQGLSSHTEAGVSGIELCIAEAVLHLHCTAHCLHAFVSASRAAGTAHYSFSRL